MDPAESFIVQIVTCVGFSSMGCGFAVGLIIGYFLGRRSKDRRL